MHFRRFSEQGSHSYNRVWLALPRKVDHVLISNLSVILNSVQGRSLVMHAVLGLFFLVHRRDVQIFLPFVILFFCFVSFGMVSFGLGWWRLFLFLPQPVTSSSSGPVLPSARSRNLSDISLVLSCRTKSRDGRLSLTCSKVYVYGGAPAAPTESM